jgi:RNA polymerase sigma-70 factor (ECF subfamily)
MSPSEQAAVLEKYRDYLGVLARQQIDTRLRGKLDASDLVQQTLLEAHQGWADRRDHGEAVLAGWLRQILARNLCDAHRRLGAGKRDAARERSMEEALEHSSIVLGQWLAAEQSSPSEQAIWHEDLLRLTAALAALPEDQRTAVELHHLKKYSLSQIVAEMGRSKPAVAGLLHRGMERLRQLLAE